MMLSLAGDINGRDADNCLGNVNIVSGEVRLELNTPTNKKQTIFID